MLPLTIAPSDSDGEAAGRASRLVLPSDSSDEWAYIEETLRVPLQNLADLDVMLTQFSAHDREPKRCSFFADIPGSAEAGAFDFDAFFKVGAPMMIQVALEMPSLFDGVEVPIFKTYSSAGQQAFIKQSFTLTRRQCACLLAHSFFGSLKRPIGVQPNDFRFTAAGLFIGTARSPNSAVTFLNYFQVLGRRGIPEGSVTFDRQGYQRGHPPWQWEQSGKPLCQVRITDGSLEACKADLHAEFANAFIGGGVMTGDFAMEEILFLIKPELMVAMAIENRMADTEVICISGALQYSLVTGFGSSFEFAGDYNDCRDGPPPKVCAIDAIRGGGPAMTEIAMLRDLNKARIAFDGAHEIATGHWGCGAFGNNHDLMFLKQWIAASEAGAEVVHYHDFDRKQSHNIVPLSRKMRHMTVGQLWKFLRDEITSDLRPADVATFSARMRNIATGKLALPSCSCKGTNK
jgi:poly(ADP-ribose) glycohydrolase